MNSLGIFYYWRGDVFSIALVWGQREESSTSWTDPRYGSYVDGAGPELTTFCKRLLHATNSISDGLPQEALAGGT